MIKAIKNIVKKYLRKYLQSKKIISIAFGRNRGLKLRYFNDLNLDMALGFHEPNTLEVMEQLLLPGMVVVDIGANIGYFSRFLSKKIGEKGKIFAFEPIPSTFEILLDTINLNKIKNLIPVQKAVTDANGEIEIYLGKSHYMASIDKAWATVKGGKINVLTTSLDDYFKKEGVYPDFIKMDIEGGGGLALEGMKECVINGNPILLLESHTSNEDLSIGKALARNDYEVFRVGSSVPIKNLHSDYNDPSGVYGTVVAIPRNSVHKFKKLNPYKFQNKKFGQR